MTGPRTLEIVLDTDFPDDLPLAACAPFINGGSLAYFNTTRDDCNPHGDGALTNGLTLNNLVDGGPAATVVGGGLSNLAGLAGLAFDGSSTATYLAIGGAGALDLHVTNPAFGVSITFKTPASGYITSPSFLSLAILTVSDANGAQWYITQGLHGYDPGVGMGTGASQASQFLVGNSNGAVHQVAMSWDPATQTLALFHDGVFVQSTTSGVPATLQNAAAAILKIAAGWKGTVYEFYIENLAVSGADWAAQVAAMWAMAGDFT